MRQPVSSVYRDNRQHDCVGISWIGRTIKNRECNCHSDHVGETGAVQSCSFDDAMRDRRRKVESGILCGDDSW